MEHKDYNGWWNYETWNVKLWMDNDQGEQEYWNEQAENADNAYKLAEQLKDYYNDLNPLADNVSVFSDLMSAALSEVNWQEIAEHLIADLEID